jgi:pyruvate,water dikinase
MYRELTAQGINIPNGFAVTAQAYFYFIEKAGIMDQIKSILKGLDHSDVDKLGECGKKVCDAGQRCEESVRPAAQSHFLLSE